MAFKHGSQTLIDIDATGATQIQSASGEDIALYPDVNIWIKQGTKLIFEGTAPDDFEAKLQATAVTADRDLILPDESGTLATQSYVDDAVQGVDSLSELTGDTDDITEGSVNLYYTDARARASISATGDLSYNSSTGVIDFELANHTTTDLAEGTNLYYTDARARSAISLSSSNINELSYDSATGVFSYTSPSTVAASGQIVFDVRNVSGVDIARGDAVYISGHSGSKILVAKADANVASTMPAIGLANSAMTNNSDGSVLVGGEMASLDTSAFSVGDVLYVSETAGELTATRPSAETTKIQNIGKVARSDNNNGIIIVVGSGRANDVPNLATGHVFIGDTTGYETRALDTDDVAEGANLYYTDARVQAVSINELSEDTTPELSGDLITGQNRIAFANTGTVSFLDFTKTLFSETNHTVLSSVKSIDFFLDSNGGDAGQAFRIYNNQNPDGTVTENTHIFKVAETGDVSVSNDLNVGGDAIITGDLTVSGTTTTINTNELNIGDNILTLNSDETGTPSQNAGIEVERGTSANVAIRWNEATDQWEFSNDGTTYVAFGTSATFTGTTDGINEGTTNLYYTDARADARIAAADTDDLSEGLTNLYYTDARARASISATGDLSYNSSTGVISFTEADTLADVTGRGASTTDTVTVAQLNVGNAFAPGSSTQQDIINFMVGQNANGTSNGMKFYENTTGFGMSFGYNGSGSGAGNYMAWYDNSANEIMRLYNVSTGELRVGTGQITPTKISNWDTAYGWGDHSTQGYLTSATNNYVDSLSFNTSDGVLTAGRSGLGDLTVDLDGRYALSSSFSTTSDVQFDSLGVGTAASGTTGEIRATNDVTSFYSSDARLKENVINIDNALDKVKQIRGVEFDWTQEYIDSKGGEDDYFVRKHDVGVIAQEVEAVLPEVVGTRDNGTKAVRYDRIVALLIEAIKEQQSQIDELKQIINGNINK